MQKLAVTQAPLHPLLAGRWSPRGFNHTHQVSPQQVTALIEAARWSPSAMNGQPWRFVVTHRGEPAFDRLFETLNDGNKLWAGAASVLILAVADTLTADGSPNAYALYDTGQAVANLITQASHEGLSTHQMGGFNPTAAAAAFDLAAQLRPLVVIAVGRHDPAAPLTEALAAREVAPRVRRPIEDLVLNAPAAVSAG
ncbi:MAG TPA: nitroreductase family protein [Actinoplanes sp.]|nr:nitroreductase family protein [Actinoplanes sp.]